MIQINEFIFYETLKNRQELIQFKIRVLFPDHFLIHTQKKIYFLRLTCNALNLKERNNGKPQRQQLLLFSIIMFS
jgi:hypothetical protein